MFLWYDGSGLTRACWNVDRNGSKDRRRIVASRGNVQEPNSRFDEGGYYKVIFLGDKFVRENGNADGDSEVAAREFFEPSVLLQQCD